MTSTEWWIFKMSVTAILALMFVRDESFLATAAFTIPVLIFLDIARWAGHKLEGKA